jgi:Tol biopolymer transport system component
MLDFLSKSYIVIGSNMWCIPLFKLSSCKHVGDIKLSISKGVAISVIVILAIALISVILVTNYNSILPEDKEVPHEAKWGIYVLDLETENTELVYSSSNKMSHIRLNNAGDKLVFSMQIDNGSECVVEGSPINLCEEVCSIGVDGNGFMRLTDNRLWDLVPCWSTHDSQIFFLSFCETLDIFKMDADGGNIVEVYDSGFHDSDLHCSGGKIVFTRNSQIWMINENGTDATQVTDPPRAGEWGSSVLPFGDYDPNLSPDGNKIVFERLVNDETVHGNYNIYVINVDGTGETALTDTGYTQGLPEWSHSGEQIVYLVSAIGNEGKYVICLMNADGSENRNVTPEYFPANFLCNGPIFSKDDTKIFFVGEWYSD